MRCELKVSSAIAWQSYDCIDMLFILNRKNRNFYFFHDSARTIIQGILEKKEISHICDECMRIFNVSRNELDDCIINFVQLLKQEEILYE